MTGKAKAALEEQTIKTLSKKQKNNSSGDSGNMNLKKVKKTPTAWPVTAPLSPCPKMFLSQQAVVHTEEEENALIVQR
ncbi:uncharacterized protein F5147DRAFT_777938 [Suillus discolor]|uniref:Uncharacterized protein n=1 Tax=Suillus discolor TaxID=1912936 RepID=A0A9P7EY60_9AGAM|nr:uncharacterized protein F5147DRAFT_777938 [Suillus discolor]KAG2097775.1 hypothetical protein F5147DRAFT_777938 [Suillus discolor]